MIFADEEKENEAIIHTIQLAMLDTKKILGKIATDHENGSFVRE